MGRRLVSLSSTDERKIFVTKRLLLQRKMCCYTASGGEKGSTFFSFRLKAVLKYTVKLFVACRGALCCGRQNL